MLMTNNPVDRLISQAEILVERDTLILVWWHDREPANRMAKHLFNLSGKVQLLQSLQHPCTAKINRLKLWGKGMEKPYSIPLPRRVQGRDSFSKKLQAS